jgi:hypothetical protein
MITTKRLENLPKMLVVTFAADCAERVLPIFERAYPDDPRPREAIAAVRDWLRNGTLKGHLDRVRGWLQRSALQEDLERLGVGAAKASAKPLGSHAVSGAPGWMTGLLANDAEYAAAAAAAAVHAARVADNGGDLAAAANSVANDAVMAAIHAWEDQHGVDFATATAVAEPRERAWQAERLAFLEADISLNTPPIQGE